MFKGKRSVFLLILLISALLLLSACGQDQGQAQPAEESAQPEAAEEPAAEETTGLSAFMVFDSSGTLRYDAHVVNGIVVDAYGNEI